MLEELWSVSSAQLGIAVRGEKCRVLKLQAWRDYVARVEDKYLQLSRDEKNVSLDKTCLHFKGVRGKEQ